LVPWSNRISAGGIDHNNKHYPMAPNRAGEPYPIHGDGWLQVWQLSQPAENTLEMRLSSDAFDGNPYAYQALQRFVLREDGMDQIMTVTHTGASPLPYGLGQHPCFLRSASTRLTTSVQGVWLSGADPMPTQHSTEFPPGWNPNKGMEVVGSLIDNAYTGWSGYANLTWPEHNLSMSLTVPDIQQRGLNDGYCLLYRPPVGPGFCFEPVTHPIDAFHVPGHPGLKVLSAGESLTQALQWRFQPMA
jgi:aldose 1-epimerase